jgi:hypothetical protein
MRRRLQIAALMALVLVLASVMVVSAQTAYQTQFITAITYQNVGTAQATVSFQFYNQNSGSPITVNRTLPAGAGASLNVANLTGSEALPANFLGSAVMSSNQPVVATLVQIANPSTSPVKNRPLSNGFSTVSSNVLLATVLKNRFNFTSRFSVQNADTALADITVKIYNADNPAQAPIQIVTQNVPAGSAKYYDMGNLAELAGQNTFNGSAVVTAVKDGTNTAANIVGSVVELQTNGANVSAFEGVSGGSNTVYMATALCNAFGGATTFYAVQNVGTQPANVTVTYPTGTNGIAGGQKVVNGVVAGGKTSINTCDTVAANYSGAATITSTQPLVVIGKVGGAGLNTAFLGESAGAAKLALPYVRWSETKFESGQYQRGNIAIQNVGGAATNVTVRYLDKTGAVVGTHTLNNVAPGAKANSNPILATGDTTRLKEFGNPEANPGGGFGGAAIVETSSGGTVIAVVRINSKVPGSQVGEDYNGIKIQ